MKDTSQKILEGMSLTWTSFVSAGLTLSSTDGEAELKRFFKTSVSVSDIAHVPAVCP